jgi:hypothetical protein
MKSLALACACSVVAYLAFAFAHPSNSVGSALSDAEAQAIGGGANYCGCQLTNCCYTYCDGGCAPCGKKCVTCKVKEAALTLSNKLGCCTPEHVFSCCTVCNGASTCGSFTRYTGTNCKKSGG